MADRGYSVKDVAERLGVCTKSIYDWASISPVRTGLHHRGAGYFKPRLTVCEANAAAEGHGVLRKGHRVTYAFIKDWSLFSVRAMCRVLKVHPSGFYCLAQVWPQPLAMRRRRLTGASNNSGWKAVAFFVSWRKALPVEWLDRPTRNCALASPGLMFVCPVSPSLGRS